MNSWLATAGTGWDWTGRRIKRLGFEASLVYRRLNGSIAATASASTRLLRGSLA